MSSVVLWSCPTTGVTASWNKEGPRYTCFVPTHLSTEHEGAWEGVTTQYPNEELAIKAAKIKAEALKQSGSSAKAATDGDPGH